MKVNQQNTLVNEMIKPRWAPICRRVWIRLARDLNDRCCLKVYFTDVNKKGVLKYKTMKQYRQHRQTNEQTRTRNTLHPYAIHIYNTDRQTDNRTRTTDILATDCKYDNSFGT